MLNNYPPLRDGGFELGLDAWQYGGELPAGVSHDYAHSGLSSARLGDPNYACSGGAVGQARASQTITVPGRPGVTHVTIGLWYRVFTQDVVIGTDGKLYDSFDVYVNSNLVLRDGKSLPKTG